MLKTLISLTMAGAMALGFVQGTTTAEKSELTAEKKTEVLEAVNKIMKDSAFVPGVDFKTWPSLLEKQKDAIDKATSDNEFAIAINRALKEFGASHIVFSTPEAATARRTKQNVGIGIQINPEDNGIRVMAVFPKSPADEVGLRPGDLITKADGKEVRTAPDLAGEKDSTVELTVIREDKELKFKVTRKTYSNVRPEEISWFDKETAVIKIYTFDTSYDRANVEKIMKEAASAKRLIVDLRNNPGGAVVNMLHFMGLVMPPGTSAGTFLSRRDVDRYVADTGGSPTDWEKIAKQSRTAIKAAKNSKLEPFQGKIAVLVNGASGSAAEITAAALAESLNAPVVGTKSAGAVLASIVAPLPHGFALQYPLMDYVTPKGNRLEGNGVQVTVNVPDPKTFGAKDEVLAKAVELLKESDNKSDK